MALVLNEEQRLLQDSARDFLVSTAPVAALRKLRDDSDSMGYAAELWQQMAELGWASIILPEQYGGLEFGFLGLGVVLEETGRTLTASPLFASTVVGASTLLKSEKASPAQPASHGPPVKVGTFIFSSSSDFALRYLPSGSSSWSAKKGFLNQYLAMLQK